MKKGILLLYFIVFTLNAHAIYFRHLGIKDGLSQLSVMSIYQDELGRMWFGTLEGLNMYDGRTITVFNSSNSPGLKNFTVGNQNLHITGDKNGNIFFFSDFSLLTYNLETEHFAVIRNGDISGLNYCKNQLYYAVSDTLYRLENDFSRSEYLFSIPEKNPQIQKIFIDSTNSFWIGTRQGLYRKKHGEEIKNIISGEEIHDIFEDSKGKIWVGSYASGIFLFHPDGREEQFIDKSSDKNSLSINQTRCFTEDNYGNIWIGTFLGLRKYNPETQQFTLYSQDSNPGTLNHNSVFSLYKGNQGTIWVGTYYGGVHYFNPETDLFTLYTDGSDKEECLSFPIVGEMMEDKNGDIWICTEGGGLNYFNRKTKKFKHYLSDNTNQTIAHNNLKGICYSEKFEQLFIATHTGGVSIFDIKSEQFTNLTQNPSYPSSPRSRIVNDIQLYTDDILLFTTQDGLYKMDLKSRIITPFYEQGPPVLGSGITVDSRKNIWLMHNNYVTVVHPEHPEQIKYFHNNQKGLGNTGITKIVEDRKGRIYFTTLGSGLFLYDPEADLFTAFREEENLLLSNYCYNAVQTRLGYMLISGNKGLTFLNPDTKDVKTVDISTGIPLQAINSGCGMLVCRNGEIFVGGMDGLSTFFEQDLFNSSKPYEMFFTELSVNNEKVSPNDKNGILSQSISFTDEIKLKHFQNHIGLTYSTNNYVNPLKKVHYEYKLDGFEDKWVTTTDQSISYTNLNPGKYILYIREIQNDNFQYPHQISLRIHVAFPLYATPFFYVLYIIVGFTLLFSFYWFKRSQLLLRTSLELERKEKEKIEEINHAKLQFFSNISHEFRTPLTLIISQMEILLQSNSLAPTLYSKMVKIYKNTYHLRNLITELLDFRKLEQGHVKLKVYQQDLIPFLKEIYYSFYEYADSQGMDYKFSSPGKEVFCWFDPRQFQKVFFNLLSNAFKYTRKNGSIEMLVEEKGELIVIKIIDNGIGINAVEIDKIFDRFYQANNNQSTTNMFPSTGIGLSLCKNIIEMHHGTIQVESTPGYGTIFIIQLLKDKDHFTEEEIEKENPELLLDESGYNGFSLLEANTPEETGVFNSGNKNRYKLLIIEDSEELLQILVSLFSPFYQIIQAHNGQEGWELVKKEMPDIIISDVMMPYMSGTELCIKIKNDFEVCHIPIILLTAQNSIEQNIEGLKRGADDYINKPFSARILLARCNNLLRNRLLLQKKLSTGEYTDIQTLAVNPIDQEFIDHITKIIEKNQDNAEFDMNNLARELNLSRSSLYAKFKALTGMTPNDFVLTWKLKKAAELLKNQPDLQIQDVADRLGFGSARYFTRCFKTQFNMTPMEYRKKEDK